MSSWFQDMCAQLNVDCSKEKACIRPLLPTGLSSSNLSADGQDSSLGKDKGGSSFIQAPSCACSCVFSQVDLASTHVQVGSLASLDDVVSLLKMAELQVDT